MKCLKKYFILSKMRQTKTKSFTENIFSFLKQFFVVVSAVCAAIFWFQGYIDNTISKSIEVAFTKYITPMQNDIAELKPLSVKHEEGFMLLSYRMGLAEEKLKFTKYPNREAILPHETKIETEE